MKRTVKIKSFLRTVVLTAITVLLLGTATGALADTSYLMPVNNSDYKIDIIPSTITHVEIPVKIVSEELLFTSLSAKTSSDMIKIYNIELKDETGKVIDVNSSSLYFSSYTKLSMCFDIDCDDTLTIGSYNIKINAVNKRSCDLFEVNEVICLLDLEAYNPVELEPSYLAVTNVTCSKATLKAGDSFTLKITIKNEGDIKILNSYAVFGFNGDIIPDYTVSKIKIGDLIGHGTTTIDVPLRVSTDAKQGVTTFSISFSGKDKAGNPTPDNSQNLYLSIGTKSASSSDNSAKIKVTTEDNYKKITPDSEDSFAIKIENISDSVIKDVRIAIVSGMGTQTGITRNFTSETLGLGDIKKKDTLIAEVPFLVSPGIASGLYEISLSVSYTTGQGETYDPENMTLYLSVPENEVGTALIPEIKVSTDDNYKTIVPGESNEVKFTLENIGTSKATGIGLSVVSGMDTSTGITKDYVADSIAVADIAAGKKATVKLPFNVSEKTRSGLYEITFALSYGTESSKTNVTKNITVYLFVPGSPADVNYLAISNIAQSPEAPKAGENVTVSFDIKNEGANEVTNLRLMGMGLSSNGFEPISMDPYVSYGTLGAGATKHVEMTFRCGNNIPSGVNALTIGWEYVNNISEKVTDSVTLYVLGVVNMTKKAEIGKPKLIISSYSTVGNYEGDPDRINAGDTIDFSFTVKNTHAAKSAKNIKLTITQIDGVFAPAAGTNIFYIDEIPASEESVQNIKLKVRADAVTGDYPLVITVEYEYDDMSEVDQEKGGVTEENTIKLHAIENYRPVIENIYIDSYMGCSVGNPVDLSFEFYNMGKSTLGNVYVTVSGDFELANNSAMSYVGAISGYGQEYINPQVVPLVGGEAVGILTVHFEDSNGDEVTLSQEFTAYVDEGGSFMDGGWDDYYDPSWDMPMDETQPEETGFKAFLNKLNVWYVYVIAGVIVAAVVVIIIISAKKKKQNANIKDTDDEDY